MIKTVKVRNIIRDIKIKKVNKDEYGVLMNGYFMSVYDIMRASMSNIRLGGNIGMINPDLTGKVKKKKNKLIDF